MRPCLIPKGPRKGTWCWPQNGAARKTAECTVEQTDLPPAALTLERSPHVHRNKSSPNHIIRAAEQGPRLRGPIPAPRGSPRRDRRLREGYTYSPSADHRYERDHRRDLGALRLCGGVRRGGAHRQIVRCRLRGVGTASL